MDPLSQPLPRRRLGKTGLDVSVVGFGCAPVAYLSTEADRAKRTLNALLDAGVNLVDTATSYPGSHEFLGEHLASRRDEFVLVSKVGNRPKGKDWSAQGIAGQVDEALAKMKTDRIDVMLLHSCGMDVLEADDALGALVEARDAGKIRFCGYSGDNDEAAFACRLPDVAVLETSVNVADQHNIDAVLPVAQKHGVGVIVKRPVANAAWKDIGEQQGLYRTYAKTYTQRLAAMKVSPASLGFDGDWPELALRFTLSQPGVATAIIGTTDPSHASVNLELATKPPLDPSTVTKLREAFAAARGGQAWTGQT